MPLQFADDRSRLGLHAGSIAWSARGSSRGAVILAVDSGPAPAPPSRHGPPPLPADLAGRCVCRAARGRSAMRPLLTTHDDPDCHGGQTPTAVASGLVASLARPGGGRHRLNRFCPELMMKVLELLKEVSAATTASPRGRSRTSWCLPFRLLDHLIRSRQQRRRIVRPSALAVLRFEDESELCRLMDRQILLASPP